MYLHIRFINGSSSGEWLCCSSVSNLLVRRPTWNITCTLSVSLCKLPPQSTGAELNYRRVMDVIVWMPHSTSFWQCCVRHHGALLFLLRPLHSTTSVFLSDFMSLGCVVSFPFWGNTTHRIFQNPFSLKLEDTENGSCQEAIAESWDRYPHDP